MSTDDGRALVQDIAAKIRILREQRDELRELLEEARLIVNGLHDGSLPACFRPTLDYINRLNYALRPQ